MDETEVARYWNGNAEAWTEMSRAGIDFYRDHLNTPAFMAMLPEVRGLRGLDLGCGEGYNTRQLAGLGARITGIDISEAFIGYARESERADPLGIDYQIASAQSLPFADGRFDFTTGIMSLMDMPDPARVLQESHRVLKSDGFLQFSIAHPCYYTPHRRNLRGPDGLTYAVEVGDYFSDRNGEVDRWTFGNAPEHLKQKFDDFETPRFTKTVSAWLNLLIDTGFALERLEEPRPSPETIEKHPDLQDASVVAYFLHVRVRKA